MAKFIFRQLNRFNKRFLPSLSGKDPRFLSKWERGLLAFRYFVLIRALD